MGIDGVVAVASDAGAETTATAMADVGGGTQGLRIQALQCAGWCELCEGAVVRAQTTNLCVERLLAQSAG